MRKYLTHLTAIIALLLSGTALAVPLTYNFSGSVSSVIDNAGSALVGVGDNFSGSFTYESTTPEAAFTVADPETAFYVHPTPLGVNGLSISAGAFSYAPSQTASLEPTVQNVGGSNDDGFLLFQNDNAVSFLSLPTVNLVSVELLLIAPDGTLGGSLALPTALDLSDYTLSRQITLRALMPSGMGAGFLPVLEFQGALTSLELVPPNRVPEPTSVALLALGLGALAFRRKRG